MTYPSLHSSPQFDSIAICPHRAISTKSYPWLTIFVWVLAEADRNAPKHYVVFEHLRFGGGPKLVMLERRRPARGRESHFVAVGSPLVFCFSPEDGNSFEHDFVLVLCSCANTLRHCKSVIRKEISKDKSPRLLVRWSASGSNDDA